MADSEYAGVPGLYRVALTFREAQALRFGILAMEKEYEAILATHVGHVPDDAQQYGDHLRRQLENGRSAREKINAAIDAALAEAEH